MADVRLLELVNGINDFWFEDACSSPSTALKRKPFWYKGSECIDKKIDVLFGKVVRKAREDGLNDWLMQPASALALILLLDQFTRNLYRNSPDAYSGDAQALKYLRSIILNRLDTNLHVVARIWLYHPLHHSECLEDQDYGKQLLENLLVVSHSRWHHYINLSITGWAGHRDIIKKFGRFPHRNFTLGRRNTPEEEIFLSSVGKSFGQGPARVMDND